LLFYFSFRQFGGFPSELLSIVLGVFFGNIALRIARDDLLELRLLEDD